MVQPRGVGARCWCARRADLNVDGRLGSLDQVGAIVTLAATVVGADLAIRLARAVTRRLGAAQLSTVIARSAMAVRLLSFAIAAALVARTSPAAWRPALVELARLLVVVAVAWVAIVASRLLLDAVARRFDVSVDDNRRARKVHTQLRVTRRVLVVVIVVVAGLTALASSPGGRAAAASLLASAGVVGLVAGIAGQSTLGNLIAGVQVAFSDSLRLDDVVVVDGEWGRVEEISLTYVVVAIWDQRRLVLPVSYFVTTPFENWTRSGAELLGSVHLFVDYAVPVEELRRELLAFVADHPLWDHRVAVLQVVESTEIAMQVRALVSAPSSGAAWDLRCAVREHLVAYIRDNHPGGLPAGRLSLVNREAGAPAET